MKSIKELLSLDTHFRWNANLIRCCFYQFTLFQLIHTNFTGENQDAERIFMCHYTNR
jgi:hypothetical protein